MRQQSEPNRIWRVALLSDKNSQEFSARQEMNHL